MCSIILNKILNPVLGDLIDKLTSKSRLSELERSIDEDIETYKSERRIEFLQNHDPNNRVPDEFKKVNPNDEAMEIADEIIDDFLDLRNGGETGLQHTGYLSDVIGRPIQVYNENNELIREIGENKQEEPVRVKYDSENEHWTLINGEESRFENNNNNCLFNVVAAQCGNKRS